MRVSMTVPTEDLTQARTIYRDLEELGYDRAFSFEAKHDPFIPLAVAAEHTSTLQLGTALAIAFARTPMTLANAGWDLQAVTGGRFTLGLGSQIRPHIEQRFSMPWSRPADRMRELVLGIRAIWDTWQHGTPLDFDGEFYTHTRMVPAFDPGPLSCGPPPILVGAVGPRMTTVAGEVADGLLVHPVNTRRSLLELTLPALAAGAALAGRDVADLELVCVTIVVTGRDEAADDPEPGGGAPPARLLRHDPGVPAGVRAARLRRPPPRAATAGPRRAAGTRWARSSTTS